MTATYGWPRWLRIYDASLRNRAFFKLALSVYGILVYALMIWSVREGRPEGAGLAELLISPLPWFLAGWLIEDEGHWTGKSGRTQLQKLDPHTQSAAFLADIVGLMPLMMCTAAAYPYLPPGIPFITGDWWWVVPCVVTPLVGLTFAWSFRKGEADVMDLLRYFSYTKLLHNGVAFLWSAACLVWWLILLVFSLVYSVVKHTWSAGPGWLLVGFAFGLIWLAGAVADSIRSQLSDDHPWKLTAKNLHPQADERGRAIWPEIENVPMVDEFQKQDPSRSLAWTKFFHLRRWPELFGRKRSSRLGFRSETVDWSSRSSSSAPPEEPGPKNGPNEPG